MAASNPITYDRQQIVRALAHDVRVKLLRLLIDHGELSPKSASQILPVTLSDASYHMRKLEHFGLVDLVRVDQVRGAAVHFFAANQEALRIPWLREAIGLNDIDRQVSSWAEGDLDK